MISKYVTSSVVVLGHFVHPHTPGIGFCDVIFELVEPIQAILHLCGYYAFYSQSIICIICFFAETRFCQGYLILSEIHCDANFPHSCRL